MGTEVKTRTWRGQDDGYRVQETLQPLVRADIIEQVREDVRHKKISDAERERSGKNEAIAACEVQVRKDAYSRDHDAREQEGRHASKN